MKRTLMSLAAAGALTVAGHASADTIDLRTGGIGSPFDGQSSGYTGATGIAGLTMTVGVSSDDTSTTIEVTSSGFGVDSGSINGADEVMTISFNQAVEITAIDFASVQDSGVEGTLDFSNNPTGDPFDIADSPSTADDIEFGTAISLPAGQSFTITGAAGESFELERIHLTVVPEPSSLAPLAVIGLLLARRRRRS